jgi:F-type H+-transporting ATPase subunit delta
MNTETIARRYSVALADVVSGKGEIDAVKSEIAVWADMFTSNADLRNVFSNPTINHADKEKLLENLISKTQPGQTAANFVRVLLQNGRLTEIGDINSRFTDVLDERRGLVSAQITSARELPEGERAEFEKNLEKLTGKKVTVNYSIDKEIIGGVVTRIGSTVYDGSVKTKLENLREQLING